MQDTPSNKFTWESFVEVHKNFSVFMSANLTKNYTILDDKKVFYF